MKRFVLSAVGGVILAGFSGFAAVWKDAGDSRQVLGAVAGEVQSNADAVKVAIESQRRVEDKLGEINRFLREDAKEQREMMGDHIKTMHRDH